jgi:hypothetical protein
MNSEKLKLYIRKIVREEIPTILREHLRDGLLEILTEHNQPSRKTVKPRIPQTNTISEDVVGGTKKPYVKYTNNEMLNEVLNNTTGGVPQDGSMVGTMGGYDTQYSNTMNSEFITESAPEPVKKVNSVINQDFRSRMEAINRVKQNKMKEAS